MSNEVTAWVKKNSSARSLVPQAVLLEMADECRPDGYLSGADWGSIAHIARVLRCDRKTVMAAIAGLEDLGEILVLRPFDRGHGRHNEYVILMGRDPRTVAETHGWSRPADRYPTGINPSATTPSRQGGTDRSTHAADPAPAAPARLRLAEPVPSGSQAIDDDEPVDNRPAGCDDRYPTGTDLGTDRSRTGPGPVPSDGPFPSSQIPKSRLPAARATRPVDKLDQVEQTLTDRGVAVVWDLGTEQRSELVAHLERWPAAAGVTALVAHAEASIRAHGLPRSARAWVGGWLGLRPPSPRSAAAECATHRGQPADNCACCRADLLAGIS